MILKVLILDDSEIVLAMTTQALESAGFQVFPASSLLAFDQILREHQPHIVLTDIQMPETTGDNICRVLKQKMTTQMIPVVLFSTIAEEELAALAEEAGADGYVCKDCGVDEIVKRIQELTDEILF